MKKLTKKDVKKVTGGYAAFGARVVGSALRYNTRTGVGADLYPAGSIMHGQDQSGIMPGTSVG